MENFKKKNHEMHSYWAIGSYLTGSFNKIINVIGEKSNWERTTIESVEKQKIPKIISNNKEIILIDSGKKDGNKPNKNNTIIEHIIACYAFGLIEIDFNDLKYNSNSDFKFSFEFKTKKFEIDKKFPIEEIILEKNIKNRIIELENKFPLIELKKMKKDNLIQVLKNNYDQFSNIIDNENFEKQNLSELHFQIENNEFTFNELEDKIFKQSNRILISYLMEWEYLKGDGCRIELDEKDIEKMERFSFKKFKLDSLSKDDRHDNLIELILKLYKGSEKFFISNPKNFEKINTISLVENIDKNQNNNISVSVLNVYELFSDKKNNNVKFYFPLMQREYVWPRKFIINLIDDINEAENITKPYYIGNILTSGNSHDNIEEVLDGQQRLISLSLILSALNIIYKHYGPVVSSDIKYPKEFVELHKPDFISDKFSKANNSMGDYQKFIKVLDPSNKQNRSDLKLDKLFNGSISEFKMLISGSRIIDNFYQCIISIVENIINDDIKNLEKFTKNLLNNIIISKLKNNDAEPFKLFERLNTSSIKLNAIELMKNSIFSMINKKDIDENEVNIINYFNNKVSNYFRKNNKDSNSIISDVKVNKFVKYILSITNLKPNKNDSEFEKFRKSISSFGFKSGMNFNSYIKCLDLLEKEIIIFDNISNPDNFFKAQNSLYHFSDILFMIYSKNVYWPLIREIITMSSNIGDFDLNEIKYTKNEKIKIRKLLFSIERYEIYVRVTSFKGSSLRSNINKIVNKLKEKNFETWNVTEVKDLFNDKKLMNVSNITPSDETFNQDVRRAIGTVKTLTSIMMRIETYVINQGDIFTQSPNIKYINDISLEHIIPQDEKNWVVDLKTFLKSKDIPENKLSTYLNTHMNMLGNCLLISKQENSSVNNDGRKVKHDKYEKNNTLKDSNIYKGFSLKIENGFSSELKKINLENEFNFDTIEKRTEKLADLVSEIYKSKND